MNRFPITSLIVYHQLAGMSTWSATVYDFDGYGNTTYFAQHDFGGTSPVIAKTITYGSCTASCNTSSPTISNSSMAANHIYNKPGLVVTQQNGSAVAQAAYTYDAKGNLDYTELWTGLTWAPYIGQTSSNTYNPNGTPLTTYNLANNETSYTYASGSYSDVNGCSGETQYPFPTKITLANGLYTQATYDCEGGVKLKDIDANGNTTIYGYETSGGAADPFWRVSSITDPLLNVAYKTYPTGQSLFCQVLLSLSIQATRSIKPTSRPTVGAVLSCRRPRNRQAAVTMTLFQPRISGVQLTKAGIPHNRAP